jgi:hypothetical protein
MTEKKATLRLRHGEVKILAAALSAYRDSGQFVPGVLTAICAQAIKQTEPDA